MSYTGHVVPGGPTDTRVLGRATIRKMSVSEMYNNVYLVTCTATGEQAPASSAPRAASIGRRGTIRCRTLAGPAATARYGRAAGR